MFWLIAACAGDGVDLVPELHRVEGDVVVEILRDSTAVEAPPELEVPVLLIDGGWQPQQVPSSDEKRLQAGHALVQLHLDLPGGGGERGTPGKADRYGEGSRAAVAAALRYAAGWARDEQGLTLCDRVPGLAPEALVVAARSNGGNLAVATLADPELDLPPVAGLATWETPAGPQFVLRELVEPETGSCALEPGGGLSCEEDLSALVPDTPPWLDRDGDGRLGDGEPVFGGIDWDGRTVHSPNLLRVTGELPGALTEEESERWFAYRDASRDAAAAVERQPGMGFIACGSMTDHASEVRGSPHVVGLAEAFSMAGAWTRLQPDAAYTGLGLEQPAGFGLDLEHPGIMLPDGAGSGLLLTAAVRELSDRAIVGDWSEDLGTVLR